MKSTITKIKKLSQQKAKLEAQLKDLMKERNAYISDCLNALPSQDIPTDLIIGSLIHTVDIVHQNEQSTLEQREAWQKDGEKFCRRIGSKTPKAKSQKAS